jgi:two-component system cell cycle sensor histidine kinase/response regulator CckA
VGKITIETENVRLDEQYCSGRPEFQPGEYVLLAISDNGEGMSREVQEKIFEPFFSTKGVGKGTGLGLSTVYGIIKQNDGFIYVYSEPGTGTTFKIYLPRHKGPAAKAEAGRSLPVRAPAGHGETVLLVEDEPAIIQVCRIMLQELGYRVLAADTPGQALELARASTDEIQLLISDVVMPEMNGRELAAKLKSFHPKLKMLFMSGYTANVIAHHSVLEEGTHFLQKPFSSRQLAAKVREVLESPQ